MDEKKMLTTGTLRLRVRVRTRLLSAKMLRALRGIAQGKTRAEVAFEMRISPNTLKIYLWKAYTRLGVRNAPEAMVKARALGLDIF